MNKKILALILVVALTLSVLAITMVSGSLAWFFDEDSAKNVFVIGSVDIEQNEVFDETTAQLLPVIDNNDPAASNMIEKKVTVSNTGDNDAYVQTLVAVPQVLDEAGIVHLYDVNAAANGWTLLDGDAQTVGTQPSYVGITIDGETLAYNVYVYRYNTALASGVTTDESIEGVFIDQAVDADYVYDSNGRVESGYFVTGDATVDAAIRPFDVTGKLNVYVVTQAVQADGFADNSALDDQFTTHAWAN